MSIQLGLERIKRLQSLLPLYTRPTIHIAGTNGKGSVAAIVEAIFRKCGYTTGRFTSPHLLTSRDSIVLEGEAVSLNVFQRASDRTIKVNNSNNVNASPFELLTATALLVFEEAQVDIVVLEVGVGGRMDATNIVPSKQLLVCAMTRVDLDHQELLGRSVTAISEEKAGIAKEGITMIVALQKHEQVYGSIERVVRMLGGYTKKAREVAKRSWDEALDGSLPLPFSIRPFQPPPPQPIRFTSSSGEVLTLFPLGGDHQLQNLSLALELVDHVRDLGLPWGRITNLGVATGIAAVEWPGRLDWVPPNVSFGEPALQISFPLLVDGAHNMAGIISLVNYIDSLALPSPRTFIISLSRSPLKDFREMMKRLVRRGDRVALVPFSSVVGMEWVKPLTNDNMKDLVQDLTDEMNVFQGSTLLECLEWCECQRSDIVVATGSLYLVADLYKLRATSVLPTFGYVSIL